MEIAKVIKENTIKEVFAFLNGLNIMLYIIKDNVATATTIEITVNIFILERFII